jgi:hypothetical protein
VKSQLSKAAARQLKEAATSIKHFSKWLIGITLRPYQLEAASAIIKSVFARDGMTFVIVFSRQSGKDELLAILFLFLLMRFSDWGIDMICAQPTFKPQTITAMERILKRGYNFGKRLRRTAGYIVRFMSARVSYFSADPSANVVSATGRLIVMNEAQDISASIADGKFMPMGANENATRVYSGTRWTADTLLERELKIALAAQKKDGVKRVFMVDADQVRKSNPWYGKYVDAEVKKMGRQHPLIKTQYFNELIDSQVGMFNATRRALMQGDQPAQDAPIPGHIYAFTIDVSGQDEALLNLDGMGNPGRDKTTLDIHDIDLSSLELLQAPTYRCVKRLAWHGENHVDIFGALCALYDIWNPLYIVEDATGVGEGLWGMLFKKYPTKTLGVKFTQMKKSEIGWAYMGIINTGRFHDCATSPEVQMQYDKCQSEVLPGPGKILRWGVKDGTRGAGRQLVHDDWILADALITELDGLEWYAASEETVSIQGIDPLDAMDGHYG